MPTHRVASQKSNHVPRLDLIYVCKNIREATCLVFQRSQAQFLICICGSVNHTASRIVPSALVKDIGEDIRVGSMRHGKARLEDHVESRGINDKSSAAPSGRGSRRNKMPAYYMHGPDGAVVQLNAGDGARDRQSGSRDVSPAK
jgi:hypothetical protein